MYSTETILTSNISPPVSETHQLGLYNYDTPGSFEVGDYLVALAEDFIVYDEYATGVESYSDETGTLTIINSNGPNMTFNYDKTRTGWIFIEISGVFFRVQVKQYRAEGYVDFDADDSTSVLEVLQKSASRFADYDFEDITLISRTNEVYAEIKGDNYDETDSTDIEIGFTDTYIECSYQVSASDVTALSGSNMNITLTIRKTNSSGDIIYTDSDLRGDVGEILVSKTVTLAEIGTAERIWVGVTLSATI